MSDDRGYWGSRIGPLTKPDFGTRERDQQGPHAGDPTAGAALTLRSPQGNGDGCGPSNCTWVPNVPIDELEERFQRQVQVGMPVPGLVFECSRCGVKVHRLRPEDRPRPRE